MTKILSSLKQTDLMTNTTEIRMVSLQATNFYSG